MAYQPLWGSLILKQSLLKDSSEVVKPIDEESEGKRNPKQEK